MPVTAILGDAGILEVTNFVDLPGGNSSTTKGRICFVTATGKQYRDNGTTWVEEHTAPKAASLDSSYITDLAEFCRDTLGAALVAGSRVTITVNDAGDTITIASDDASTAEFVRDTIGTALVAGTGVSITVNDAGDTITLASTITQYTDEMVDDRVATLLVAGTNVTLTYNDAANTLTIAATGGGSGGHIIQNDAGTNMTARGHLQFIVGSSGATLTDDSGNDRTILNLSSLTGGSSTTGMVSETVLAVAAATITVTIPAGHRYLKLEVAGRTAEVANNSIVRVTFNGDTGSNYDLHLADLNVGAVTQADDVAAAFLRIGYLPGASATANVADGITLHLIDYEDTTFHKHVRAEGSLKISAASGNIYSTLRSGYWRNTAAITSVTLVLASGANFLAGTSVRLFSPSAGGGSGGGAMAALHDEVLAVDTATLTYTPPTSGYRDLIVAIDGRTDEALGYSPISMRFNADTGANYDNFIWEANSGGAANANAYAATAADVAYLSGNTAPAGVRSKLRVEIADYLSTTFNKQATTKGNVKQGTSGALLTTATRESWWRNSAAITSLTFLPTTSGKKFLTGTRFTVWGIKAS
jgi:hypothetical protein